MPVVSYTSGKIRISGSGTGLPFAFGNWIKIRNLQPPTLAPEECLMSWHEVDLAEVSEPVSGEEPSSR